MILFLNLSDVFIYVIFHIPTFVCFRVTSYGRVYTTDPYHALAPAAAYGVGAMVRTLTRPQKNITFLMT